MSDLRYSLSAIAVLAEFNGTTAEHMTKLWPIASNAYMHRWLEALGRRNDAGLPIYSGPLRLLVPGEIA